MEYRVVPANKKALGKVISSVREKPEFAKAELVSISPQQFAGAAAGKKYLEENCDKWEDKCCPYVSVRNTDELKTPKIEELRSRITSEEMALSALKSKTDPAFFKSRLAGCTSCESKVNRKYIKDSKCPVCGADMRSPSAAESIKRKEESIQKLKIRLSGECAKHAGEAPLRYLVAVPADPGERKKW